MAKRSVLRVGGVTVRPGETKDIRLKVSESYTGDDVSLPIRVIRARREGPTVFVSAAIHGDETNGTGIVHDLMFGETLAIGAGAVILVPVLNIFGFESQERYMPDGRDLNRNFPGSTTGSLTSRIAGTFFRQVVRRCNYGLDLHTAASQRTNYPNVRGDLSDERVHELARAFGCELMVSKEGPEGSLRREATKAGCPTIVLEAGEPLKIQPGVLEVGIQGVVNVLRWLEMLEGEPLEPDYQVRIDGSTWVRAEVGGLLRFHVAPGQAVKVHQPIATNYSVHGDEQNVLAAPVNGVVLGMTTLPTVKPGEPVCHLAKVGRFLRRIRLVQQAQRRTSLPHRLREQLATNITVSDREEGVLEN